MSDGSTLAARDARWARVVALGAAATALACSPEVAHLSDCEPSEGVTPICGFVNPEDLALVAGTPWIVVAEFPPAGEAGSLVLFRSVDGERRRVYPAGPDEGLLSASRPVPGWGDPECPGPPDLERFAPHGIDTRRDAQVAGALAVVNHGGRQAVELFEVGYAAGGPALGWRGCVVLPEGTWPNDVAFWPGGGFAVTNMMHPPEGSGGVWSGVKLAMGATTGNVLRWSPDTGLQPLAGSEGSGPNGVAVSPDGSQVFFAEWGAKRLVRLRLDEEPSRTSIDMPMRPDNLSWARDGRLLVAGQRGGFGEVLGCGQLESGTCRIDYTVVSVEPTTLETREILVREATSIGAVSTSLHVGGELFIGTFAGDRIARARYPRPDPIH